jgi:hypothetical protein
VPEPAAGDAGHAETLPEAGASPARQPPALAAAYALFFMFQNGITSGIATMSESVSR